MDEEADFDIYRQFEQVLANKIKDHGLNNYQVVAELVTEILRNEFGGTRLYLPETSKINKKARNAAIRQEFTGQNLSELMQKHHCSKATIYRAISRKTRQRRG